MNTGNYQDMIRKSVTALTKRPSPLAMQVTPDADIYETTSAYVVKLDMPGATRETVSVAVELDSLVVRGEVVQLRQEGARMMLNEIPFRKYERGFTLGAGASREEIQAVFEAGVLTITVPKTEETKSMNIQVR